MGIVMCLKKNKALHEEKFPASRKRKNMIQGQLKRFKTIFIYGRSLFIKYLSFFNNDLNGLDYKGN